MNTLSSRSCLSFLSSRLPSLDELASDDSQQLYSNVNSPIVISEDQSQEALGKFAPSKQDSKLNQPSNSHMRKNNIQKQQLEREKRRQRKKRERQQLKLEAIRVNQAIQPPLGDNSHVKAEAISFTMCPLPVHPNLNPKIEYQLRPELDPSVPKLQQNQAQMVSSTSLPSRASRQHAKHADRLLLKAYEERYEGKRVDARTNVIMNGILTEFM